MGSVEVVNRMWVSWAFHTNMQVVSGPVCPGVPGYSTLPGGSSSHGDVNAQFWTAVLSWKHHRRIEVEN